MLKMPSYSLVLLHPRTNMILLAAKSNNPQLCSYSLLWTKPTRQCCSLLYVCLIAASRSHPPMPSMDTMVERCAHPGCCEPRPIYCMMHYSQHAPLQQQQQLGSDQHLAQQDHLQPFANLHQAQHADLHQAQHHQLHQQQASDVSPQPGF